MNTNPEELKLGIKRIEAPIFDLYTRFLCMECPGYNKHYTCPPYTPLPSQAREITRKYKYCHVIYHYFSLSEIWKSVKHLPQKVIKLVLMHRIISSKKKKIGWKLFRIFSNKGLFLGIVSPCNLCRKCACLERKPCRKPSLKHYPPESWGIDVYTTLKENKIPFEVVPRKYSISVAFLFTNKKIKERKILPPANALEKEYLSLIEKLRSERELILRKVKFIGEEEFEISKTHNDDLIQFLEERRLYGFRIYDFNPRNVQIFKDFFYSRGIYDRISIGSQSLFDRRFLRARCFSEKEIGIKIKSKRSANLHILTKFPEIDNLFQ